MQVSHREEGATLLVSLSAGSWFCCQHLPGRKSLPHVDAQWHSSMAMRTSLPACATKQKHTMATESRCDHNWRSMANCSEAVAATGSWPSLHACDPNSATLCTHTHTCRQITPPRSCQSKSSTTCMTNKLVQLNRQGPQTITPGTVSPGSCRQITHSLKPAIVKAS